MEDFYNYTYEIVRRGNWRLLTSKYKKDGTKLMKHICDNYRYWFNRYYYLALENDIQGRINRLGLSKKLKTNKGISPLHVACINPDITVLKKLYTVLPDYSIADSEHRKLMHYAAANESDSALNFLIPKGVPINDKDRRNYTPLMIACELGRVNNIITLLKAQKSKPLS